MKTAPPLVTLLSSPPEVQWVALRNINLILQKRPDVLSNDMRVSFCKYNDPPYAKVEKLDIMGKQCWCSPERVESVCTISHQLSHLWNAEALDLAGTHPKSMLILCAKVSRLLARRQSKWMLRPKHVLTYCWNSLQLESVTSCRRQWSSWKWDSHASLQYL